MAADVLDAIARLQEKFGGTPYELLVDDLVAALAADTTVAELRQEVEFFKAEKAAMQERIDNFTRLEWSLRNRAEVAERGHKACLAREADRA